ncbi:hypothetical protein LCGC14_1588440 [marine sediment metagenome]|uniref:Uncharacterized protein n=1 Tax=marine sediment metagenome TaxID=412755 RepID=A0A0F9KVI2_9ZZZZ|nr:hypothetical protein [Pricia sp.]
MALRYKRKPTLQKRKDEYNKSFAKAKRDNKGKIPANFPTFANWKKQLYDKYETKPKRKVRLKPKKKKVISLATKSKVRGIGSNLSYAETQRMLDKPARDRR